MKEKLMTLSMAALRDIAKDKNVKNISVLRKNELIDAILEVTQENNKEKSNIETMQPQTHRNETENMQHNIHDNFDRVVK